MKAIVYLRVSTAKQGRSGLGLEAQREIVARFLGGAAPLREFVEIESGRKADRPQLRAALDAARLHGARLVVAKLDRLSRNVGFLMALLDGQVEVAFADMPAVSGPTGRFLIQSMAAVAELEAGLISDRTKAALKAAKARGTTLGGWRGGPVVDRAAGTAALRAKADATAQRYGSTIVELRSAGIESASGMARELNARGIPSPRGGSWQAVTVQRIVARLAA